MLDHEDYEERWKKKLAFYGRNDVKHWTAAFPEGRLIVTDDVPKKGLDSAAICTLIGTLWGR